METVRTAVTSLCVSMIFFGVIMMLIPKGKMQKPFKTFASVAVVAALISSCCGFSSAVEEFELELSSESFESQSSELSETVNEQSVSAVESSMSDLISEYLGAAGIKNTEISVLADISETKGIYITNVTVVCDKGDADKCRQVLNEMSLTANITERE